MLLVTRREIAVRAGFNQGESESKFVYVRVSVERFCLSALHWLMLKNVAGFGRGKEILQKL